MAAFRESEPAPCRVPPLTSLAHSHWEQYLRPGDWALDATAGTGRDTVALARMVQPQGRVFAIDIQEIALRQTSQALAKEGLLGNASLLSGDHSHLRELLPCRSLSRFRLICFNLGYLPGGDHGVITNARTTLLALQESKPLLANGGILSVMVYRGHAGATAEATAVESFFSNLSPPWRLLLRHESGTAEKPGPVLYLADSEEKGSSYPR